MNYRRLGIALGVMLVVVGLGLLWEQTREMPTQDTKPDREKKIETPSFDAKKWEVSPEATVGLKYTKKATDGTDLYPNRFTVPGKVEFDHAPFTDPIKLQIEIRPVKPSRARELANQTGPNPIARLMQGGPKKAFDTSTITRTVTTDKTGKFLIKDAIPGIYSLSVLDTGLLEKKIPSEIEIASRITPLLATLTEPARLKGRVVNTDGNPLPANVTMVQESGTIPVGADGQFTLDRLIPGEKISGLLIQHKGYSPYEIDLPAPKPGQTIEKTFTLSKSSVLRVEVRTKEGEPVTDGKIILRRTDDKKEPISPNSIPHGRGKIVNINNEGVAVFESVLPGSVRIRLTFTNYIAEPRDVTIEAGGTTTTEMTVTEGIPFTIRFIDESTGQEAGDVLPAIRVFDAQGQEITPGFSFTKQKGPGSYSGVFNPRGERFRVRVKSPNDSYKTREITFTRTDLPELAIRMVPKANPRPGQQPSAPGLVKLKPGDLEQLKLNESSKIKVWVLNLADGSSELIRTGKGKEFFSEPYPLRSGQYLAYATIRHDNGPNRVALKRFTIESKHPGSRSLSFRNAATISGQVSAGTKSPAGLQVGISLLDSGTDSNQNAVFYPDPLKTSVDKNGKFTLKLLPPETSMTLQVVATGKTTFGQSAGSVLTSQSISPLLPGSEQTIPDLTVSD